MHRHRLAVIGVIAVAIALLVATVGRGNGNRASSIPLAPAFSAAVVFTIVNKGQLPHTFAIRKLQKVSLLVQPGRRATMRVTFRKTGKYYWRDESDYFQPDSAVVERQQFTDTQTRLR
jgi:CBS domain containing-hemolysin-like protein